MNHPEPSIRRLRSLASAAAVFLAVIAVAAPELSVPSFLNVGAKQATLTTTLSEEAAVTVLWGPSSGKLWRSADLGTCAAGEVSHTEYTLLSDHVYCFQVVASNATGVVRSEPVVCRTDARAPACPRYSGGWYDGWAMASATIAIPRPETIILVF